MKKLCLGNNSYINVRLIDFSALNYLCIYLPLELMDLFLYSSQFA